MRASVTLLATLILPFPLVAQSVQGRLLDAVTNAPVPSATVQLLRGADGTQVVARGVTDEQGAFQLTASESGTYRLRSLRVGYEPATSPAFDLMADEKPLEVEFHISSKAVLLAPLTIVSQRPARVASVHLEIAGFYDRQQRYGPKGLGLGQFLDQEQIRETNPSQVSDVLRNLRGVWVVGAGGRRQRITFRGHGLSEDGRCVPEVFLNGTRVGTGADIDEVVVPWSLAAVEVYTGLSMPAEFMRMGNHACGVIALWTGFGGVNSQANAARRTPGDGTTGSSALRLDLMLAADSVGLLDSLVTHVKLSNVSQDTFSVCVTDARYTLRGGGEDWAVVEGATDHPCLRLYEIAPRGTRTWRELVDLSGAPDGIGSVVIQKLLRIRLRPCDGRDACEVELRSALRSVSLRGGARATPPGAPPSGPPAPPAGPAPSWRVRPPPPA